MAPRGKLEAVVALRVGGGLEALEGPDLVRARPGAEGPTHDSGGRNWKGADVKRVGDVAGGRQHDARTQQLEREAVARGRRNVHLDRIGAIRQVLEKKLAAGVQR